MADSLFTATPANTDATDGPAIATGTTVTPTADVLATHHRFYCPTTGAGTVTAQLWRYVDEENTPQLLDEVVYAALTPGAYNTTPWSSPVPLTVGEYYLTSHHASGGHYVFTAAAFGSDVVSPGGLLVAIATGSSTSVGTLRNGKFVYSPTPAFASQNGGSLNFHDDLVVVEAAAISGVLAATMPAFEAAFAGDVRVAGPVAATMPAFGSALTGSLVAAGVVAATMPAMTAAIDGTSDGTPLVTTPGVFTAGGRSATLTAAGRSSTLTAAGRSVDLTAGGKP